MKSRIRQNRWPEGPTEENGQHRVYATKTLRKLGQNGSSFQQYDGYPIFTTKSGHSNDQLVVNALRIVSFVSCFNGKKP